MAKAAMLTTRVACLVSEMIDMRGPVKGDIGMEIAGNGGANYTSFTTDANITDGAWHHVAWRRDGLTSTSFVDGCLGAVKVHNGVADFANNVELTLGKSPCTSVDGTTPFVGAMDEIQIYLRALGDGEIGALAERGQGADLDGSGTVDGADLGLLLGAWGPCPGSGCCLADLNGDGHVDGSDLGLVLSSWG